MQQLPKTPAARQLAEVIKLIPQATPERLAAWLPEHYTPSNMEREPLVRRIGTFMDWQARGGFELHEVTRAEPYYVETVARQPVSDEHWRLAVQVEAVLPHRIEALLLGRQPLPVRLPPSENQDAADSFLRYVDRLATANLFSGAVLIARHGRILAQGAFGFANRDFDIPNNLDTRFNVASLTKSWTAVAICQLIEAGRLSLETRVADFIDYPDADSARKMRIEHLLTHTAGLDSYFTAEFDRTARKLMRSVDDFLALTRHQLPAFEPGTSWKYSNTGMVLLGKIIEILTGQSYFEYVEQQVLAKAGMVDSGFFDLDQVNKDTAVGYTKAWDLAGPRYVNSLFEGVIKGGPAGCGYATVADVFRFAEALRGGRLVSPSMVERMTSAKPALSSPDYGYGFAIHPQRVLFGHSGGLIGASANLDITRDPGGWIVVVLANDLSMRPPTLKGRQLIGIAVPEAEEARAYLPRAGMTPR